ncbi:Uma2 family endonuclease [Streptomyces sp. NPDC059104]|uniref:Uma2 family endonuclease n=1 Tax=Streptomyces sp. NPDC059104 TaxID=3346729 RepID=UPI0036A6971C
MRSRLALFEDAFPGRHAELLEGSVVLFPVRPACGATAYRVWDMLAAALPREWSVISGVPLPFDERTEFCPDLAVLPAAEADKNLSAYSPDLIELAVEVVSPSSVRNDYEVKDRAYARRGIPHYLIFDPYKAQCTTLWNPGPDGYRGRDVIPYGGTVVVETGIGKLSLDTSPLPVDPGTPA